MKNYGVILLLCMGLMNSCGIRKCIKFDKEFTGSGQYKSSIVFHIDSLPITSDNIAISSSMEVEKDRSYQMNLERNGKINTAQPFVNVTRCLRKGTFFWGNNTSHEQAQLHQEPNSGKQNDSNLRSLKKTAFAGTIVFTAIILLFGLPLDPIWVMIIGLIGLIISLLVWLYAAFYLRQRKLITKHHVDENGHSNPLMDKYSNAAIYATIIAAFSIPLFIGTLSPLFLLASLIISVISRKMLYKFGGTLKQKRRIARSISWSSALLLLNTICLTVFIYFMSILGE